MISWYQHNALRKPLFVLSGALGLVVTLLIVASHYYGAQTSALVQAQLHQQQAQHTVQQAMQTRAAILKYLPKYTRLQERGFFNRQQRQQWVETLIAAQQRHHLLPIDYDMGQPVDAEMRAGGASTHYVLQRTVMTLHMPLLHAGDFARLLQHMRQSASPFLLRDCTLSREAGLAMEHALQPEVVASCEVHWLVLQLTSVGSGH